MYEHWEESRSEQFSSQGKILSSFLIVSIQEKKCKKAKWLSGEALQIAVKRREVKSKGKKQRYKHLFFFLREIFQFFFFNLSNTFIFIFFLNFILFLKFT